MRHLFLLVFVVACATTPSQQDILHASTFQAPFEEVWSALVDVFRDLDLPTETLEEHSGHITTGWFGIDPENDYVDCGRQAPGDLSFFSGRLDVQVRAEGEVAEVGIRSSFRASMRDPATNYNFEVRCYSTGRLEAQVSAHLGDRIG